jgi:hypothetical protein
LVAPNTMKMVICACMIASVGRIFRRTPIMRVCLEEICVARGRNRQKRTQIMSA